MVVYASFEDFVSRGSPKLFGTAVLLLGDRHAAEDVTQEALIQMYRAWSSIRTKSAVDSYAYRTLVRIARRRWRRRSSAHLEILTDSVPESPTDGSMTDDVDLRRWVRKALAKLPPRQRETLALRFYADLTVEQAARVLGCSEGTVKSQTSKGLKSLERLLVSSEQIQLPG